MDDLISRQDVIKAVLGSNFSACTVYGRSEEGMATAKELIQTIKNLPSAHPLNPCETCLHKGKGWDEDPCDGCTGTESKYEPIVSPDGTLIVNVPKGTKVKRVIVLPYADG